MTKSRGRGAPCVFCEDLLWSHSRTSEFSILLGEERTSQVLAARTDFVALVDISPLAIGHCLVVPRDHVLSFAELGDQRAARVQIFCQELTSLLRGTSIAAGFFMFEHGTGQDHRADRSSGKCARTEHAHLHCIPASDPPLLMRRVLSMLRHQVASTLVTFAGAVHPVVPSSARWSYLALSETVTNRGAYFLFKTDDEIPSQLARRAVSDALCCRDNLARGDWRDYVLRDSAVLSEIKATLQMYRSLLPAEPRTRPVPPEPAGQPSAQVVS
jgi:HIT domain